MPHSWMTILSFYYGEIIYCNDGKACAKRDTLVLGSKMPIVEKLFTFIYCVVLNY